MKIDRHSYYRELESNENLIYDKEWIRRAFKCVLDQHQNWKVYEDNLERIVNTQYTKQDYLDFISLNNKLIAKNLRDLEKINWYRLYSKFSKYLYEFYDKYKEKSGKLLYETYINYKHTSDSKLPWIEKFERRKVNSIDPVHIFASFNYFKIPLETRKERMKLYCELLKLNDINIGNLLSDVDNLNLDSFWGLPLINITYIVSAREVNQQKDIWKFFSLIYNNEIENSELKQLFNGINDNWYGIGLESATIFMFWVNSDNFIPLDKNTVALLQEYDVINKVPVTFDQYKRLLYKKNTYLYRNLARVAFDKETRFELIESEVEYLDSFLEETNIVYEDIEDNIQINQLNLDFVLSFDFELYFMIDGKVKKITYENNEITSYIEMKLLDKPNYNAYPNFQLIAIRSFNKKYSKCLDNENLYYFNSNFKILTDEIRFVNQNAISIYQTDTISNINISAIVGKNGTGKSTIIELLIMAINNIAKSLEENDKYDIKELSDFFYTVHTNYSLHSLNENHYEGKWLHKLFHKNDSYQTPIVIEPFREEGIIDINKLEQLTKQRLLSTLLEPSSGKESKKLTNKQEATHLDIIVNEDKMEKIVRNMIKDEIKSNEIIGLGFEDGIKEVLTYQENIHILDFFLSNYTLSANNYVDIAKVYICYKIKNIAKTYNVYKKYKNNVDNEEFLTSLFQDKSHITFKLHQVLNFLKFNTVEKIGKVKIEDISSLIKDIQLDNENIKTIELIPPSFFDVNIILDDDKSFNLLSSGEKQKIYSISSILYHLQNLESVHRGSVNNIKYKYVNLILDEIELYFHPDMQRTFISDLLTAIDNNGALNNIVGLNILLVTHSPFILSDIMESQILYLTDNRARDYNFKNTFGANIHTLLDDSFFMQDGLMGKYSKDIINNILSKLNLHRNEISKEKDYRDPTKTINEIEQKRIKRITSKIGEPFLKQKIFDMYFSLFDENKSQIRLLEKEKQLLEEKIEKLKK